MMTKLRFLTGTFGLFLGTACGDGGPLGGTGQPCADSRCEEPATADDGDAEPGPDGDGAGDDDGDDPDGASGPGDGGDGDGTPADDGGDGAGDGDGDGESGAPVLPAPSIDCPELSNGTVMFGERSVRIYMDEAAAAEKDGPLVFYWYGTYGNPGQAEFALGDGVKEIMALGGIVAAPAHANATQFPWLDGALEDDFQLADDVIACAEQKVGIDERRLHSLGMSAGGLFTTDLSYARGYFASVAAYSGGGEGTFVDPVNQFAALVFYGGPTDNVFNHDFQASTLAWTEQLRASGHRAELCNHGFGHFFPPRGGAAVTAFFLAHPYGVKWAYEAGLPEAIPDYCEIE
jgi:hypothetical protein